MHKVNAVNNHLIVLSIELLVKLSKLVKFLLFIEIVQAELFLENTNEAAVLF